MTIKTFATALLASAALASTIGAQETARVGVAPDSKLWIDGTSNVHGWTCRAEKLEANIDLDKAAVAQLEAAPPKALKKVEVRVPVRSLKCGHDGMDNNLYKALGADATPDVTYILASFEAVPGESADSFTLKTAGTLTIAGKEKPLAMSVQATRSSDGSVRAKGTVAIKMTDFGINPPRAMLGTLRTGDEVKVTFDLGITSKAIAAALNNDK